MSVIFDEVIGEVEPESPAQSQEPPDAEQSEVGMKPHELRRQLRKIEERRRRLLAD